MKPPKSSSILRGDWSPCIRTDYHLLPGHLFVQGQQLTRNLPPPPCSHCGHFYRHPGDCPSRKKKELPPTPSSCYMAHRHSTNSRTIMLLFIEPHHDLGLPDSRHSEVSRHLVLVSSRIGPITPHCSKTSRGVNDKRILLTGYHAESCRHPHKYIAITRSRCSKAPSTTDSPASSSIRRLTRGKVTSHWQSYHRAMRTRAFCLPLRRVGKIRGGMASPRSQPPRHGGRCRRCMKNDTIRRHAHSSSRGC